MVSERPILDQGIRLTSSSFPVDVGAVVGDMTANGVSCDGTPRFDMAELNLSSQIQRTPIASRMMQPPSRLVGRLQTQTQSHHQQHVKHPRSTSASNGANRSHHSMSTISDRSEEDLVHIPRDTILRPMARNDDWIIQSHANLEDRHAGESCLKQCCHVAQLNLPIPKALPRVLHEEATANSSPQPESSLPLWRLVQDN